MTSATCDNIIGLGMVIYVSNRSIEKAVARILDVQNSLDHIPKPCFKQLFRFLVCFSFVCLFLISF